MKRFRERIASRAMTPHVSPWAERLKMNRRTLANYTAEMHSRGWIRTSGEGSNARRYLTPAGREYVDA